MSGELIRVAALVITAAVLIIVLRSRLPEYAFLLTVAVIAIILIFVLLNLWSGIQRLKELFNQSENIAVYFTTALKALGISYITVFAADVCRDFGLTSLALTTETVGKITIFTLSIPLAVVLLEAALKFVGI